MNAVRSSAAIMGALLVVALVTASAADRHCRPGESIPASLEGLRPGDSLILHEGVYREGVQIAGLRGTAEHPITIRGQGRVVLRPPTRDGIVFWGGGGSKHVVLENLRIEKAKRGGIVICHSEHITIRRCVSVSNGVWGIQTCASDRIIVEDCETAFSREQHGIYFSSTDNPVAKGCRVHNNGACGIHFNGAPTEGGDGMIAGGLVEDCVISGNGRLGGAAINMDGVQQTTIRNNLIHGNFAGGIVSFRQDGAAAGGGNLFELNTVYFERNTGRFGLKIRGKARGTVWRGNIIVCGPRRPAIELDAATVPNVACARNVYFGHGGTAIVAAGSRHLTLDGWRRLSGEDAESVAAPPALRRDKGAWIPERGSAAARLGAGWRWAGE